MSAVRRDAEEANDNVSFVLAGFGRAGSSTGISGNARTRSLDSKVDSERSVLEAPV